MPSDEQATGPMTMDLTDQVALITGGANGIGAATARALAERGARIVVADIDAEAAELVAEQVSGVAVACDVTSTADLDAAVAAAMATYGGLHIVILNAGVGSAAPYPEFSLDSYRRVVAVDLDGVVLGAQAALPALRASGGGRIVAVASLGGLTPMPLDPVYAAAKAGVIAFVRSAAPVLLADGVRLTGLCPGFAATALTEPLRAGLDAAGLPLMQADDVVAGMLAALGDTEVGTCWLVQYGHEPQPFRFRGVPGPRLS